MADEPELEPRVQPLTPGLSAPTAGDGARAEGSATTRLVIHALTGRGDPSAGRTPRLRQPDEGAAAYPGLAPELVQAHLAGSKARDRTLARITTRRRRRP